MCPHHDPILYAPCIAFHMYARMHTSISLEFTDLHIVSSVGRSPLSASAPCLAMSMFIRVVLHAPGADFRVCVSIIPWYRSDWDIVSSLAPCSIGASISCWAGAGAGASVHDCGGISESACSSFWCCGASSNLEIQSFPQRERILAIRHWRISLFGVPIHPRSLLWCRCVVSIFRQ